MRESRMLEELGQLDERLGKLTDFIASKNFTELKPVQRLLLERQLYYMKGYAEVLRERCEYA